MPLPSTILMIRPAAFGFNEETAGSNFFQYKPSINQTIHQSAIEEFDNMVNLLLSHHIDVIVMDDTADPAKPDAIFPNNWLSTSPGGIVSVFPMYAANRRAEKRDDILNRLKEKFQN